MAALTRHVDWHAFEDWRQSEGAPAGAAVDQSRDLPYTDFAFADGDILLFGRESAGVPDHVHRGGRCAAD